LPIVFVLKNIQQGFSFRNIVVFRFNCANVTGRRPSEAGKSNIFSPVVFVLQTNELFIDTKKTRRKSYIEPNLTK